MYEEPTTHQEQLEWDKQIEDNIGLIWTMLKERYLTQDEDALQEAYLALCEARINYNKDLKIPFGAYAANYIKRNLTWYKIRRGPFHIPKRAFQFATTVEDAKRAQHMNRHPISDNHHGYEVEPDSYRFSDLLIGLNEYESAIVTMYILERLPKKEIAKRLNTNHQRIIVDFARAKRRLKRRWKKYNAL